MHLHFTPMEDTTNISSPLKEKLDDMVEYAKSQPLGVRHFLEISSFPLSSVSITFQTIAGKGGHLVWNQEPPEEVMLSRPEGDGYDKTGYQWYMKFCTTHSISPPMSKIAWVGMFNLINSKVDNAISINHGVLCEKERNTISFNSRDKLLFHICDILVMLCEKMSPSTLTLRPFRLLTASVCGMDLSMISDEFVGTLTNKEKEFLFHNADFLYVLYGYWANHSMLPIRLNCPTILPNAYRISNTFRFMDHMEGKLIQLQREHRALLDKRLFMF